MHDISELPKNTQWPPSERLVIGLPAQSLSEYASKEVDESPLNNNPKELVCFRYAKQRKAVSQCNARGDEKYCVSQLTAKAMSGLVQTMAKSNASTYSQ